MSSTRRDFLGKVAVNAAVLGAMPLSLDFRSLTASGPTPMSEQGEKWDVSWPSRLTGKHKAVFDVPEVDSGYGVWRASIWGKQYQDVLGVSPKDMSAAVVMRHNGIVLAMQQSFWDKYGIGKAKNALHPVTQQPTDRNPALLSSSRGEVPEQFDAVALDKFIARGGIALACNLALADCVELVKSKDGVSDAEARKQALAYLVPGVILQPSGVFAAIRAQEAGATYLRAS
ncbi:MAG TPA: hypothetical protein VM076_05660 [Gemmatimonadaceae bacterium]|nr:hypothetical protein [Gemmatimonadaceae bacterium]